MHYRFFPSLLMLFLVSCLENESSDFNGMERAQHAKKTREIQEKLDRAQKQRDALKRELARQIGARIADLKKPTWTELKDFIQADDTDKLEYVADKFDCNGFALRLYNNALFRGFRSAYVFAGYKDQDVGHALNKFQLTTGEMVYVDNTGRDQIAFIEKGRIYGSVPVEAIRAYFKRCGDPMCNFLIEHHFPGSLFDYEFFEVYTERVKEYLFWRNEFNSNPRRTARQRDNLEIVFQDLGGEIFKISKDNIVATIEEYWN